LLNEPSPLAEEMFIAWAADKGRSGARGDLEMARRYQVMRALPAFSTGSPWRLQVWPLQFCALQPDQRLMGLATASRGSASDLK
jgi:hypothetical protein